MNRITAQLEKITDASGEPNKLPSTLAISPDEAFITGVLLTATEDGEIRVDTDILQRLRDSIVRQVATGASSSQPSGDIIKHFLAARLPQGEWAVAGWVGAVNSTESGHVPTRRTNFLHVIDATG